MSGTLMAQFHFRVRAAAGAVMSSKLDGAMYQSLNALVIRPYNLISIGSRPVCFFIFVGLALANSWGCRAVQKSASRRSAQCQALCAEARAARERGNQSLANECLNEALRQKPSDLETRRRLAETMWNNGRRAEAATQYATLHDEYPRDEKLAARLAVMQWESNQRVAASKTAAATLQLDPHSKEAWLVKARSEAENGDLDGSLASYYRLSQLAPDDLTTLIELGELHLRRGHPDQACPLFKSAMTHVQATPEQKVETEWLLGVAYSRCERWCEAIDILERVIASKNDSADDWCFLGWTRLQAGDLPGAKSALAHAEQSDPSSLTVRKLAKLLKSPSDSAITHRQVSSQTEVQE